MVSSLPHHFVAYFLRKHVVNFLLIHPLLSTFRLDKKKTPYDLVWEDNTFLSGKVYGKILL